MQLVDAPDLRPEALQIAAGELTGRRLLDAQAMPARVVPTPFVAKG